MKLTRETPPTAFSDVDLAIATRPRPCSVLRAPKLLPRYLADPETERRLGRAARLADPAALIDPSP